MENIEIGILLLYGMHKLRLDVPKALKNPLLRLYLTSNEIRVPIYSNNVRNHNLSRSP